MENKIYNDDVERIVNDPERQEAINAFYHNRIMNKQRKIFSGALLYAVLAVAFCALGYVGWFADWLAYPIASVCAVRSAFGFGRYCENTKVYGWK